MRRTSYSHDRQHPLWRRVDRAAGDMNPYLIALAIGLAVLNATCLVLLAPQLAVTSHSADSPAAPVNAPLRSGT